jgi:hypothetical protein
MNFKDIITKYILNADDISINIPTDKTYENLEQPRHTNKLNEFSTSYNGLDFVSGTNKNKLTGDKKLTKHDSDQLLGTNEPKSKRFTLTFNPSLITKHKHSCSPKVEKEETFKNLIQYQVNSGKILLDDGAMIKQYQQQQLKLNGTKIKQRSLDNFESIKNVKFFLVF